MKIVRPRPRPLAARHLALALAGAVVSLVGSTAPRAEAAEPARAYRFGTHPARTNVAFVSEADLETIHGVAHSMSGAVTFDPAARTATGRLTVPVKEMRTGIEMRDAHMRGEQGGTWLEAATYPEVVFEITRAVANGAAADSFDYEGRLTLHGVTRPWKGRATVRFIPASVAGPAMLGAGDWVRVKTEFEVPIEEFGVKVPEGVGAKVSTTWRVSIDAYGTTQPPAGR